MMLRMSEVAQPPRWVWTKRMAWMVALLVLGMVFFYAGWDVWLRVAIRREESALREMGVALTHAEVPTERTASRAAMLYRDAAASLTLTLEERDLVFIYTRRYGRDVTDVSASLAANGRALALMREASGEEDVAWATTYPLSYSRSAGVTRELSTVACAAALHAHDRGMGAEAMAHYYDALRVERKPIGASVIWTLAWLASVHQQTTVGQHLVQRADIGADAAMTRKVIAALLDEKPHENALTCLKGGWSDVLAAYDTSGFYGATALGRADRLATLRYVRSVADAVGARDAWTSTERAREIKYPVSETRTVTSRLPRQVALTVLPAFTDSAARLHVARAQRRVLAAAFAVRLYELEQGKLPATLEALVPAYLPAVPEDPFAPGQKVRYVSEANDPRVYSVGENFADDKGVGHAHRRAAGEILRPWDEYNRPDLVMYLRLGRTASTMPKRVE